MATAFDVAIVGAGHGGAQAAISLRQSGFEGSIVLIGDEPDAPYERPPLSKDYLLGEKSFERIMIRPLQFWADRHVELRLGKRVTDVDVEGHRLQLSDGSSLGYGKLIWATGGEPRRLVCSGADLKGLHTVRNRADVDRMLSELPDVQQVVVIGGGYIGLEAAAVLTKLGKKVVILEAQDRVLARVAGEPLSRFFENEHRAHGVDVRLNAVVDCIEGVNSRVTGVRLADGEILPAQMVVVGIGILPSVAPLLAASAKGANGVWVDAQCRTSLPDIFAIGDCALHANRFAGGAEIRLESVQNAHDQATVVAKTICGQNVSYDSVPWFWSNQYDLKLQTVGLSTGYDEAILRGDPANRSFSLIYLKEGRVIALDCVNMPRDYVQGRKLVEAGTQAPPARLADPSTPLKELAV